MRRWDLPVVNVLRVTEVTRGDLECIVVCCFCTHVHVHGLVEADMWRAEAGPRMAQCKGGFYLVSMRAWQDAGSEVCR